MMTVQELRDLLEDLTNDECVRVHTPESALQLIIAARDELVANAYKSGMEASGELLTVFSDEIEPWEEPWCPDGTTVQ